MLFFYIGRISQGAIFWGNPRSLYAPSPVKYFAPERRLYSNGCPHPTSKIVGWAMPTLRLRLLISLVSDIANISDN